MTNGENLLANPAFNDGHHNQKDLLTGEGPFSDCVVPDGWWLYWLDKAGFPGVGTDEHGDDLEAFRPESVVWNISGAPANEKDVLFLEPPYCLKVFKAWAPVYFALCQNVAGLEPGRRYRFTAQVYPDIVERYKGGQKVRPGDEWSAEARAGWSAPGDDWSRGGDGSVSWSDWFNEHGGTLEFGEYGDVTVELVAPSSGEVAVWLECKAKWGFQNNWFMDAFSLVAVDGPEPPPPPPGEIDVRAAPWEPEVGEVVTIEARDEDALTSLRPVIAQPDGNLLRRDYVGLRREGDVRVWSWATEPVRMAGTHEVRVESDQKVGACQFEAVETQVQEGYNKIGPHVQRAVSRIDEWAAAGAAVMKIVGDAATGKGDWHLADLAHPNTLVVGRATSAFDAQLQYNSGKTPLQAAAEFVVSQSPAMDAAAPHGITYWEGHNEPQWGNADEMAWYAEFEAARMEIMAREGLRCVIGGFSTGTPPLEMWPAFFKALEAAKKYKAILGLHEYSDPWMWWMTGAHQVDPGEDQGDEGWTTLRYRKAYRQHLLPAGLAIPLVVTECGLDPLVNPKPPGVAGGAWRQLCDFWKASDGRSDCAAFYFEQLDWYQRELAKDDYVVGACVFTHGAYHPWEDFDVADSPVEDLAIADALARPAWPFEWACRGEEPEGPGDCRGAPRAQYARKYVLFGQGLDWRWKAAAAAALDEETIGSSADDAGVGDLDDRLVVAVNPARIGTGLAQSWYDEHYPGAVMRSVEAANPFEAAVMLRPEIERAEDMPVWQNDPRWKDLDFGEQPGGSTIGKAGCLLSVWTRMVREAYGRDATPPIVDRLNVLSGEPYVDDDMLVNWLAIVHLFPAFDQATKKDGPFNGVTLKGMLDEGWLVGLRVQGGAHFVYLEDVTATGLRVHDPWDGRFKEIADSEVSGVRAAHIQEAGWPEPEPAGRLVGAHDRAGGDWMAANGVEGWCIIPHYGASGGALDLWPLISRGVRPIVRLSYSYARRDGGLGGMPAGGQQLAAFEEACARTVNRTLAALPEEARELVAWVYANEMNNPSEQPDDGVITPTVYKESYDRVIAALAPEAKFGPMAVDPYNAELASWGDWRQSFGWVLESISHMDHLAAHAYCRTPDLGEVWSTMQFSDAPLLGVYYYLRVVENQIRILPRRYANVPVYVTETSHFARFDGSLGWEQGQPAGDWVREALGYFGQAGVDAACFYRFGDPADPDHPAWGFGGNPCVLDAIKGAL